MTVTTDGKTIVYAVFNADGCECKDLVGVFGSDAEAQEVRAEIETLIRKFYADCMGELEWHGSVTVEPLVLGEYKLPADAQQVAA